MVSVAGCRGHRAGKDEEDDRLVLTDGANRGIGHSCKQFFIRADISSCTGPGQIAGFTVGNIMAIASERTD